MDGLKSKKYNWIKRLLLFAACLPCACHDTYISSIPNYPVYLEINISTEYPHFVPSNIYSYLIFEEQRYLTDKIGYAGVLVFIGGDEKYYAFDLACPNEAKRTVKVEMDGIFAVCPECGEAYDLSSGLGVPTKGICTEGLKRYATTAVNGKVYVKN